MNALRTGVSGAAIVAVLAGSAHAQLLSPSFESPGAGNVFANWTDFNFTAFSAAPWSGANIRPNLTEPSMISDGFVSVEMYPFGAPGTFQIHQGVTPGDEWTASIDCGHLSVDPITGDLFTFLAIAYGNTGDAWYETDTFMEIASDTTVGDGFGYDTMHRFSITHIAPLDCNEVQITIGIAVTDANYNGRVFCDLAELTKTNTGVAIPFYNGNFDDFPCYGRPIDGFNEFGWTGDINAKGGNIIWYDTLYDDEEVGVAALSGTTFTLMFGQYNGVENTSGMYQGLPASAGEEWEASIWAQNPDYAYTDNNTGDPATIDPISSPNEAFLVLQFVDAGGSILQDTGSVVADSTTATNTWVEHSVVDTAPTGTAEVRLVLSYVQGEATEDLDGSGTIGEGDNPRGNVFYEDAALGLYVANTCIADVTTTGAGAGDPGFGVPDGQVTGADIQFYVNAWVLGDLGVADVTTTGAGVGDPGFGVPDGQVTGADIQFYVNAWVAGCP